MWHGELYLLNVYNKPTKALFQQFIVAQQATVKLPDDDVCTLQHVGAAE
jgi:hypothetical protein